MKINVVNTYYSTYATHLFNYHRYLLIIRYPIICGSHKWFKLKDEILSSCKKYFTLYIRLLLAMYGTVYSRG